MFPAPEDTVFRTDPALKRTAERYSPFWVNQGVLVPTDGAEVITASPESILQLRESAAIMPDFDPLPVTPAFLLCC